MTALRIKCTCSLVRAFSIKTIMLHGTVDCVCDNRKMEIYGGSCERLMTVNINSKYRLSRSIDVDMADHEDDNTLRLSGHFL